MAKPTALVSVITPYRNAAQWLSGLVETLQNQTYGIGSACWWITAPRTVGRIFSSIVWPMICVFDA